MWSSRCSSELCVFLELPGTLFSDSPQELPPAQEYNLIQSYTTSLGWHPLGHSPVRSAEAFVIPYHRPRTCGFSSSFSYSPMSCIAKNTLPEVSCRKPFTGEPALQTELWKSQTTFILSGNHFHLLHTPKTFSEFQSGFFPLNQ